MERIVISFQWRGAALELGDDGQSRSFAPAAKALLERRAALGGRIVAWHSRSFAFDFSLGEQEEAIALLIGDDSVAALRADFGVGVAQGVLVGHYESGAHLALASGAALERATALAALAAPGEVLVDPALEPVRSGRLLTRGAELGTAAGRRIRGLRLDSAFPWRRPENIAPLASPILVGPDPEVLVVGPGELGLLVAPRGSGGTRMLSELTAGAPRTLTLRPWIVGEPLGALRDALDRAGLVAADLPAVHAATLDSLFAGEGAELDAAGALVGAWIGSAGLVVIDDVSEIDADSLEVIAFACRHAGVRAVARVREKAQVSALLAGVPRGGQLLLGALDPDEAARLLRSACDAAIADETVARWARRGGGRPLAIVEAVRYGLESAELVRDGASVLARGRLAGRGGPQPARHWMLQRMRFLDEPERAALDALLALGGQARWDEIAALLDAVGQEGAPPNGDTALVRGGWIVPVRAGEVALASATLRDVLCEQLSTERGAHWLATASELRALADGPLVAARAAVHAVLAGRADLGGELARRAAAAAHSIGLEATAAALGNYAESGSLDGLRERGLLGGLPIRPMALRGASAAARPRASLLVAGTMVSEAVGEGLAGRVADALRAGDRDTMDQLAEELRTAAEQAPLADRLEAMASLRRGDVVTALRLARAVKMAAQGLGAAERCRAALTFAVALGAAGRPADALLEALDALARAREAGDPRGEDAAARFLAQLNESAGHPELASAWRELGG